MAMEKCERWLEDVILASIWGGGEGGIQERRRNVEGRWEGIEEHFIKSKKALTLKPQLIVLVENIMFRIWP